jgi:hypothetical protein
MDKVIKEVIKTTLLNRLWLAWLGGMSLGMLLLASAYVGYRYVVVGSYRFHALQFIERDIARPHPDYDVYINGARAKNGLVLKIPDGPFAEIVFSGPIYATNSIATFEFVPLSGRPAHRVHRFEVQIENKQGICEAVFEIRGTEPVFLGCSGRAFTEY